LTISTSATIEVIVQSSTVALLQHLGIAAAPAMPSIGEPQWDCLVGIVSFQSPEVVGTLTLAIPDSVGSALRVPEAGSAAMSDWLRELTNQLIGRIKNRLLHYHVSLQVGLPETMKGPLLERERKHRTPAKVYAFRTLRGIVLVTLDATFHRATLDYSGGVPVSNEGDLIEL
jgi:hypothetical protein